MWQMFDWIVEILNTPIYDMGGLSISAGLILGLYILVKAAFEIASRLRGQPGDYWDDYQGYVEDWF